jgi:hypothetical protein
MTPVTQVPPRHAVDGSSTIDTPRPASPTTTARPARSDRPFAAYVWAATRLCLGWTFLWPFLDKTFGLGHETASADAWISGGNPTEGFLSHSRKGIGLTICGAKNPRNVSNPDAENDGELLTARLTSGAM